MITTPDKKNLLINTDNYKLFYREYTSLEEFLKLIITMPINRFVFHKIQSDAYYEYFHYFQTFKEAWDACYYGWDYEFETFKEKIANLETQIINDYTKSKELKISGYYPNVPAFLKNNPRNMINTAYQVKPVKTIIINFSLSYPETETKDAIINRGVCLICLIKELEKTYNVKLNIFAVTYTSDYRNEMIYTVITVKKERELLNLKKLYFPLVNPDFLRRLLFRNTECHSVINPAWESSYGLVYFPTEEDKCLNKNSIYISFPSDMGIVGENLKEDYQSFLKYIESNMNTSYTLKHKKIF